MVVNQAMKSVQLFARRNGTNSGNRQRPLNKDKPGNSWMVSFLLSSNYFIVEYTYEYDWTIVSGIEPTTGSSDASTSETSESEAPEEDDEDDEV